MATCAEATHLLCCETKVIWHHRSVLETTRHASYNVLIVQFIVLIKVLLKCLFLGVKDRLLLFHSFFELGSILAFLLLCSIRFYLIH